MNDIHVLLVGNLEDFNKNIYNKNRVSSIPINIEYRFENKELKEIKEDIALILLDEKNIDKLLSLCKKLRKISDKPIVVLGKADSEKSITFLKAGADDYIVIPISENMLEVCIYTHVRRENRGKV